MLEEYSASIKGSLNGIKCRNKPGLKAQKWKKQGLMTQKMGLMPFPKMKSFFWGLPLMNGGLKKFKIHSWHKFTKKIQERKLSNKTWDKYKITKIWILFLEKLSLLHMVVILEKLACARSNLGSKLRAYAEAGLCLVLHITNFYNFWCNEFLAFFGNIKFKHFRKML